MNQIDHVLVSKRHRTSVIDTRAMRGADIASDHQLVRTKIKIKLKRKMTHSNNSRRKFDTTKLQLPSVRAKFSIELRNRFDVLQDLGEEEACVENQWQAFETAYKETAKEVLGYKGKGQKPWISRNSWDLVEERRLLKRNME